MPGDEDEDDRGRASSSSLPRLPPEIVEEVVSHLSAGTIQGDAASVSTLHALALVNKACRHWALRTEYDVVVLPRHVRQFRQWYAKVRGGYPPYQAAGYARCLFSALDDVSRLTTTSAGWEAELLRLLHHLGPQLNHLSLWHAESRALLRDPAQVRGPRFRNRVSIRSVQDAIDATIKRRRRVERSLALQRELSLSEQRGGGRIDWSAVTLKRGGGGEVLGSTAPGGAASSSSTSTTSELEKSEIAAAKERARQKMPNWLRLEIQRETEKAQKTRSEDPKEADKALEEVRRRYKAHLSLDPREYAHEKRAYMRLDEGQNGGEEKVAEKERRDGQHSPSSSSSSSSLSSSSASDEEEEQKEKDEKEQEVDEEHVFLEWGCMPKKLSLCAVLPLYEHEDPLNFMRMQIFTRVEDLDVFISVPAQVPRVLELFSSLEGSPIRRLRFSSVYATLVMAIAPFSSADLDKPRDDKINLCKGLQAVLKSEALNSTLQNEFTNRPMENVGLLERALVGAVLAASRGDLAFDERLRRGKGLSSTLFVPDGSGHDEDASAEKVRVRVIQGNQAHWGKLKDRKDDFLNQALGGQGAWEKLGMWDR